MSPLTTDNLGSALLSGARPKPSIANEKRRVRVLRGFLHDGRALKPGEVVELPAIVVIEAVAIRRVELIETSPPSESSFAQKANAKHGGRASTRFKTGGAPPDEPPESAA